MQDIVLSHQFRTVLWALLFGACAAAVYDGVRFVRTLLFDDRRGSITAANIADILYGIVVGCTFSVFLFIANSGRFRWYLLVASAAGFALYRLAPGKIISRIFKWLAKTLRLWTERAIRFLYFPVSVIIKSVKNVVGKLSVRRENKLKEKEKQCRKKRFSTGRIKKGDSG